MSLSSDLDRLEQSGQWTQVLEILRQQVSLGIAIDADHFHAIGRLYQRLGVLATAERAYLASLRMDPNRPLTCNNLALLALHRLQPARADQGLIRVGIRQNNPEHDLLNATGCPVGCISCAC